MLSYFKSLVKLLNNCHNKLNSVKINYRGQNFNNKVFISEAFTQINLPRFRNSAMDGYAYKKFTKFSTIKVKHIYAGDNHYKLYNNVTAIMTGARVPLSFNYVIKYEDTFINKTRLTFLKQCKFLNNIRLIGEDFRIGEYLYKSGELLSSYSYTAKSLSKNKALLIDSPSFFFIYTGNEIENEKNQITNKNNIIKNTSKIYLESMIRSLGFSVSDSLECEDSTKLFKTIISKIVTKDSNKIIITTGAVSKGKKDFIPSIMKAMGINIIFHRVNIKPGKPILFANYGKANNFFCLPGNPISSIIGLRFFVYPFLRKKNGLTIEKPLKAKLLSELHERFKKDSFLLAKYKVIESELTVTLNKSQESFKISNLRYSNAFVFVKKGETLKKGNNINIYLNIPNFND